MNQLRRVHALTFVVYLHTLENLGSNQYDMTLTGKRTRQIGGVELGNRNIPNDIIRLSLQK